MTTLIGGLKVSRETYADLKAFADLVVKWTPKINLIGRGTVQSLWDRHIADSVQIYHYAPENYRKWLDIGSGGGFPGLVIAIIAKTKNPAAAFVFIESDQRKAAFLRTVARELGLSVNVIAERIEEVPNQTADVVSARALASLSGLMPLITRHMNEDGLALLHKGKQAQHEIAEARQTWAFLLEDHPSLTDPEARLLAIQRISRRG